MDIVKAFDSLDHFLNSVLKKFGFKKNLTQIKILSEDQQSCVINGGTTQYFNVKRGARQGDLVSAHFLKLGLEILFLIKKRLEIKGIEIFEHCFSYATYADDTFFMKDGQSVENLVEIFQNRFQRAKHVKTLAMSKFNS